MSEARPFLVVITDFNKFRRCLPVRAFRHADAARQWVDQIHALLCEDCDKGKSDDYVEVAVLYRIAKDGRCLKIDEFSGLDRGDGLAGGWELECSWRHADDSGWGCSRSRMKGKAVCAFHANQKNQQYCAGEEGLFAGTYESYKNARARIAQLRADLKDEPAPNLSGLSLMLLRQA